jgi:hypothetical protein
MPHNPIQIVLNAQDYVRRSDINPGGQNKDFFEGRNAAFAQHRSQIAGNLTEIKKTFTYRSNDEVIYAKVELQTAAWAKSHRPIQKLFPPRYQAYVGGAELGSMVVELTPADIPRIISAVNAAEELVKESEDKNGKLKLKPTRSRSEVGAIKSIRAYTISDRRQFSLEQATKWLADPRTGSAYYVETFVSPQSIKNRASIELKDRGTKALAEFEKGLRSLNLPIDITTVSENWTDTSIYIVKIRNDIASDYNLSVSVNSKLLAFLDNEQIVKSILLPPILQTSRIKGEPSASPNISPPEIDRSYPIVGIVDSGVSKFSALGTWSSGASDYINEDSQDVSHGTFIAGLICAADELNTHAIFQETKCRFFDLGLHPTAEGQYANYYPRGFIDFLEQLDAEIPSAKERGVRVFNMSLAITTPIADNGYSLFANILDEIADKHDIIFVLPAGNLDEAQIRDEWPTDPNEAMSMLATYRFSGQDRIFQPADSIRALVIGALDPQLENGKFQPSRYTRRGPGPALGAKPDLAHIGGRFHNKSGLRSLSPDGSGIESCGTSYSSPLVAKCVAAVDHAIQGSISREALTALVIHHAFTPAGLDIPLLKPIAKDFIGAGIPRPAIETLLVSDHEITLVFNGILQGGHELNFQFAWPTSLVDKSGRCSGNVSLTLVYRPPVDRSFGGEFVRINLDAYLRQEVIDKKTGEVTFKGRLKDEGAKRLEKELVKHGAKWWPVKTLKSKFKNIGHSSQWRLVIDPLARSEFVMPEDGIPFSAILTIADESGTKPVFNEMRLQLQNSGATISDIRTALRQRVQR